MLYDSAIIGDGPAELNAFGEGLDCELPKLDGLKKDEFGRTTIPGLYATRDSSYFMLSHLIFAEADGNRIAMRVNIDLTEEDFV